MDVLQCSWEVNIQIEFLMYEGTAVSIGKWPPALCLLAPWKVKTWNSLRNLKESSDEPYFLIIHQRSVEVQAQ